MRIVGKVDILGDETVAINWFSYLCEDYNLYGKKNALFVPSDLKSDGAEESWGRGLQPLLFYQVRDPDTHTRRITYPPERLKIFDAF